MRGEGSASRAAIGVETLVYFEEFADVNEAIQREKSLKRYLRQWKINLIEQSNPQWLDSVSWAAGAARLAGAGAR